MKIFRLFSISVLILTTINSNSQSGSVILNEAYKVQPNGAESEAFAKFGMTKSSNSTGNLNLQIPLYTIQLGDISLPFSLNYQGTGNKVGETSSSIGLGWTLTNAGSIERKINGGDDLEPESIDVLNYTSSVFSVEGLLNEQITYDNLAENRRSYLKILDHLIDAEPDEFHFSVGSFNGSFVYNQNTLSFVCLSDPKVKIEQTYNGFDIVDAFGVIYSFSQGDILRKNIQTPSRAGVSTDNIIPKTTITNWVITDIYNPANNSTITFNYNYKEGYDNPGRSETVKLRYFPSSSGYNYSGMSAEDQSSFFRKMSITSIDFDNGRIVFEKMDDRIDCINDFRLSKIQVFRKDFSTYKLFKEFRLNSSYFISEGVENASANNAKYYKRLKLNSVIIGQPDSDNYLGEYKFEYNESLKLPHRRSFAIDHWGYYNGQLGNSTYCPGQSNFYGVASNYIGANREVNPTTNQAWILTSIYFPSGGKETFEYESNNCYFNNEVKLWGGLRVKRITDYDGINQSYLQHSRQYEYLNPINGITSGVVPALPEYFNTFRVWSCDAGGGSGNGTNGYCSGHYSIGFGMDVPTYANNANLIFAPNAFNYQYITESVSNGSNGKTLRKFTTNAEYPDYPENVNRYGGVFNPKMLGNGEARGRLVEEINFVNSNNQIVPKFKTVYDYEMRTVDNTPISKGIQVCLYDSDLSDRAEYYFGADIYYPQSTTPGPIDYDYTVYSYKQQHFTLNSVEELEFDEGTQLWYNRSKKNYVVNSSNLLVSSVSVETSKSEKITETFKYAADVSSVSNQNDPFTNGVINLINHNAYGVILEASTKIEKNGANKIIAGTYNKYLSNSFLPQEVYKLELNGMTTSFEPLKVMNGTILVDNKYVKEVAISKRDEYGNVLEQVNKNGDIESIFWGYGKKYPIAILKGQYYDAALNSSLVDINKVNYPSTEIELVNEIAKFRSLPNSFVKSYTYLPLVGITSETDPNGRNTYYEYDPFGRLLYVRDHNNNIVKKYCYNYAGQTINCFDPVYKNSISYSGSFQRTNCGTNFTGSTVTYTVPIYGVTSEISEADANAKAQLKVQQEGPAYANANGVCTPTAQPGSCTLTTFSPIYFPTYSLYCNGSQTTGYIVVWFPNGITMGSTVTIGAFSSGSCKPTVNRYQTVVSGGRTYAVTYSASGTISVQLVGGGNLPAQSTISISSINFNL